MRNFFIEMEDVQGWGIPFWKEHWAIRTVSGLVCFFGAGIIAGLVGRQHGKLLGVITAIPGIVVWIFVTLVGFGVKFGGIEMLVGTCLLEIKLMLN